MDCLRSFSLNIRGTETSIAPETTFWSVGTQHFFSYQSTNLQSQFQIQGFKNINIYKIEVVGNISNNPPLNTGIIQDWSVGIQITGDNSIIGGNITSPNGFGLIQQTVNPVFVINKFYPFINFNSPINSGKFFTILNLYAQGIGSQNLLSLNIGWDLTFTIYYLFEGE
jgi:hypothetical protein